VTIPQPKDWQAEQFRLTAFTPDSLSESALAWWKGITGAEPESKTSRAPVRIHSAEGPHGEGRLILNIGPGRIDWVLVASATKDAATSPTIGPFDTGEKSFSDLAQNWLKGSPVPMTRLAFGGVAWYSVPNKLEGYKRLAEMLPHVKLDPVGSADFLYQINRPRPSKSVPSLRINRLTKWSVMQIHLLEVVTKAMTVPNHHCRVELDINTDPENTTNLPKDAAPLFKELAALGTEILGNGDIA